MSPLVSIGMPVYNGELYITQAINSLINQSFSDFELIISDNCSTDETQQICKNFELIDKRIRYIRQEINIGAAANFKFVLSESIGTYFMWNAADDYRSSDCLSYYIQKIGNAGLAFSSYARLNRLDNSIIISKVPTLYYENCKRDSLKSFFVNNRPSFYYGLFRTMALRQCMPKDQFDWSDSYVIIKMIYKFGVNSFNDTPKYFAGFYGDYVPKPNKGNYINPFPYFFKILPLAIYSGPQAILYHFYTVYVSLKINYNIWKNLK